MFNEAAWLAAGATPARNIRRGRFGRNTVYFPSIKNNAQVVCESALEADYCIWLEWDRDVKAFYPQPYTFRWTDQQQKMCYTPDFYVTHINSPNHFTEVKADFEKTTNKFKHTLESFITHPEHQNIRLKFADTSKIVQPVRLKNLKYLYHRLQRITYWEIGCLREFLLHCNDKLTLNECIYTCPSLSLRALSLAIFSGQLVADLNIPLTMESTLTKGHFHEHSN